MSKTFAISALETISEKFPFSINRFTKMRKADAAAKGDWAFPMPFYCSRRFLTGTSSPSESRFLLQYFPENLGNDKT